VPTTLNPAGTDLRDWQRLGFTREFATQQIKVIAAYARMGIETTCTCTPYYVGNVPPYGAHLAWSESSAVCYANAVLGARTNREGGPSALAAAICGRTADYGLHRDAARRATHRVGVRCPVAAPHEYAALGYEVGRRVADGVPWFEGLDLPPAGPEWLAAEQGALAEASDRLKLLGAALASSGAVALYHIAGVTPEARQSPDLCPAEATEITIESLEPATAALNTPVRSIDLVVLGCPHASLDELRQAADCLRGKHVRSALWITSARAIRERASEHGWVQAIEEAGGQVVADGCVVVAPMRELRYHTLATNSAKMASYALPHAGLQVRFGSTARCLEAALTGTWPDA
ncbi:MAG: DUF521 domain-containing protein, partial [Chloroflexi bacterium]|nr:DUF521 domain-containing protein [Chloroflexota bacterium]